MSGIFIECKKTDRVDFVKPLRKYIQNIYGKEQAQNHEPILNNIMQLREDLRLNSEKTDSAREKHLQYYAFLNSLEKHFPLSERGIRINFYWYDSVSKKRGAQYELDYERACIHFNIAAIESQIGFLHNRLSDDGIKLACKYYQMSAGSFESLVELVRAQPGLVITPDLNVNYLTMLQYLMLGQAQECFYVKAQRGGLKPAILVKLASQVYDYFEKAVGFINMPELKPSIHAYWPTFLTYQIAIFKGLANLHMGQALDTQYGIQLAWYRRANAILSDPNLHKKLKSVSASLQEDFIEKYQMVRSIYQPAEADNNTVYHEIVPKELPPLEMKSMVKPLPFQVENLADDPFKVLVPSAVSEILHSFTERKLALISKLEKQNEENDQLAKSSLISLHLPDSLRALETQEGLPLHHKEQIKRFKDHGGIGQITNQFHVIGELSQEASEILKSCSDLLDKEEQEDKALRSKYGDNWRRDHSHSKNHQFRQEIRKYQGNVDHATKSDEFIKSSFSSIQPLLVKLSASEDEIIKIVPPSDPPSEEVKKSMNTLKQSLAKLEEILGQREKIFHEATTYAEADDISGKLLQNPQSSIAEEALGKYKEFESRLQENYDSQAEIISIICSQNEQFVQTKSRTNSSTTRDQFLQQIDSALKSYFELSNNVKEGTNFYTRFKSILLQLKAKCDQFVAARSAEKNEMLSQFSQQSQAFAPPGMNYAQVPAQYLNPQYRPANYPSVSGNYNPQGTQQAYVSVQGPDGKQQFVPAQSYYYSNTQHQ